MMKHLKQHARPKIELPPLSPEIDPRDADAFARAIAWCRAHGKGDRIEREWARDGFEAAGLTAAYSAQCTTLHLKPWEAPPMHVCATTADLDPNVYGCRPGEVALHDRLLAAGLSIYEPDPLNALARINPAA
jgi:hypothetical protein